jgi:hypothetical protein
VLGENDLLRQVIAVDISADETASAEEGQPEEGGEADCGKNGDDRGQR